MSMNARARLMTWHVVLYTLTLAVVAALCHGWVRMALDRHHDDQLSESGDRLAASLENVSMDRDSVATAVRSSGIESRLTAVLVRNASGEMIYTSSVFHVTEPAIARQDVLSQAVVDRPELPRFLTATFENSDIVRFVSVPVRSRTAYVQVGILVGDVESWLHSIEFWSFILIPAILVLTSLSGWFIIGRVLSSAAR